MSNGAGVDAAVCATVTPCGARARLACFGALVAMQRGIKCPKCKAKLGQTIAMSLAFSWGSGPKVNFCPFCGVNLDEPRPGGRADPIASQNPIKS